MNKMELWKNIKNYKGYYQISDLGNVRALERIVPFIVGKPRKRKQRILKMAVGTDGYYNVRLCKGGKAQNLRVSRLVATHFVNNPNNYPAVNHLDANKLNNMPSNLEWCTIRQNNEYTRKLGRNNPVIGENNHFSSITNLQALAIKVLLNNKFSRLDISKVLGISYEVIRHIDNHKTWKNIVI